MNGKYTVAIASAIAMALTAQAATLDRMAQAIENRSDTGEVRPGTAEARVVRAQILLDRARFSPGQIDGQYGGDLGVAVKGYQEAHHLNPDGIIGAEIASQSIPDGYTLLVSSTGMQVISPQIYRKLNYHPVKDFEPISLYAVTQNLLVVNPTLPIRTVKDLVALSRANPGKYNMSNAGSGFQSHLAGVLFTHMAGIEVVHVPYKGSGEARNAVIGGHVQMMLDAITTMAANARAGQVRALGTTGLKRSSVLPEVPTIAEAGVTGYEATIWLGLMAPVATPKPIVDRLNAEVVKIISRPDLQKIWAEQGAVSMIMEPAEFDKYLRADIAKWAHVVEVSGAKVE